MKKTDFLRGNQIFFIACGIGLMAVPPSLAASQGRAVKQGNQFFEKGDYATSIEKYKQAIEKEPESDIINYNLGTAYYKDKKFDKSIQHLQKGLLSEDETLKQKSQYNLGNAFYQQGLGLEEKNIDAAIANLENSLKSYLSVVNANKEDQDAASNYEFVKKELERLKKKKKEQQKQEQQKKQKNRDQKKDQQASSSSKQGGESDQKQGQKQNQNDQQSQDHQSGKQQEKQDQKDTPSDSQKQDQQNSSSQQPDQNQQQQVQATQGQATELTKQEAQRLLQKYQQSEEPKGLLNFYKGKAQTMPVLKDW